RQRQEKVGHFKEPAPSAAGITLTDGSCSGTFTANPPPGADPVRDPGARFSVSDIACANGIVFIPFHSFC
ncbi:MAG: hypothetical protein ACOYMS_07495, partial [Terrimicrobiaceae bacterium]